LIISPKASLLACKALASQWHPVFHRFGTVFRPFTDRFSSVFHRFYRFLKNRGTMPGVQRIRGLKQEFAEIAETFSQRRNSLCDLCDLMFQFCPSKSAARYSTGKVVVKCFAQKTGFYEVREPTRYQAPPGHRFFKCRK